MRSPIFYTGKVGGLVRTFYHITKRENLPSIMEVGLRPSIDGSNGPGVYVWAGPPKKVMETAEMCLHSNHSDLSQDAYIELCKSLAVIRIDFTEDPVIEYEYDDYVVLRDYVPTACLSVVGSFWDMCAGGQRIRSMYLQ